VLVRLLKNIFGTGLVPVGRDRDVEEAAPALPLAPSVLRVHKLESMHRRAPLDRHLGILYGDVLAGGSPLLELTAEAARRTGTSFAPFTAFNRRHSVLNLIAYFLHARRIAGSWVECGVFTGFSGLTLCLAARSADAAFDGTGFHFVDSFEGLSPPVAQDQHSVASDAGAGVRVPPVIGAGHFRVDFEGVKAAFGEFPGVQFHKGWIPDVLRTLPETTWSFVHVDVDLYQPTRDCLEYFLPRLAPGGVIVCDDYGSALFPGAERAWDEVCLRDGIPFVELPTGQAVILKDPQAAATLASQCSVP